MLGAQSPLLISLLTCWLELFFFPSTPHPFTPSFPSSWVVPHHSVQSAGNYTFFIWILFIHPSLLYITTSWHASCSAIARWIRQAVIWTYDLKNSVPTPLVRHTIRSVSGLWDFQHLGICFLVAATFFLWENPFLRLHLGTQPFPPHICFGWTACYNW